MTKSDRSKNGFTILEVMIAMAIFSIGVLGLIKMQIASSSHNVNSRLSTQRAAESADWIELTMNLAFDDDGTIAPIIRDRYEITKTVTNQVVDADITDLKVVDSVKRIDIFVWKNIRGQDDDNDGSTDEADEGEDAGVLYFTTTYYKALSI